MKWGHRSCDQGPGDAVPSRPSSGGAHQWLRATGSTLLSQIVDTAVINFIFWTGKQSTGWIFAKVIREYGIKVVVAVLLTPVVYAIHAFVVSGLKIAPSKHEVRRSRSGP